MAKSKRPNRSKKRIQIIYSEKRRIFKENYLSPKGQFLLKAGKITKKEAWEKYGKKRYIINPNAKPIREVIHRL